MQLFTILFSFPFQTKDSDTYAYVCMHTCDHQTMVTEALSQQNNQITVLSSFSNNMFIAI